MQYLRFVGCGPSSKTCPRWEPHFHTDYRLVAQEMYAQIKKKHPKLARIIKFADMRTYDLERFESEKRTEVKKRAR